MEDQTYRQYHFLRRTLQFLVSVSLFSLFLCFSSGSSLVPKPLIFYIDTGVFSCFSHYLERKYMFLICNGILAILAKSSVSSSRTSASGDQSNLDGDGQLSSTPNLSSTKADATHVDQEVPVASVQEKEEATSSQALMITEEEKEATSIQASMITEEEEFREEKRGCLVKQEEEGDEGDEELASTEELNRRIEEFIRKMKEEIRIEAQQQLIAV